MSENPLDSKKLESLLRTAAERQGTTVESLEQQAAENPAVRQLLQDPEKIRALLERPEIAGLLRRLKGEP